MNVRHNWCFWTVVLEKALESPLDYKEIKLVTPKGNQSWIFIERTDTEASILWPPDAKNWLIGKDPDAGEDWRQEEKETIEDEIVGWHHQLDGHEFEQAPGVSDRQGSLVCCRPPSMGSQRIGHDWMTELNCILFQGFPSGSAVKNLPTLQETWETEVQSLGGEGGDRGWDGWMASLTQCIWVWAIPEAHEGQGSLVCHSPWGHKE